MAGDSSPHFRWIVRIARSGSQAQQRHRADLHPPSRVKDLVQGVLLLLPPQSRHNIEMNIYKWTLRSRPRVEDGQGLRVRVDFHTSKTSPSLVGCPAIWFLVLFRQLGPNSRDHHHRGCCRGLRTRGREVTGKARLGHSRPLGPCSLAWWSAVEVAVELLARSCSPHTLLKPKAPRRRKRRGSVEPPLHLPGPSLETHAPSRLPAPL